MHAHPNGCLPCAHVHISMLASAHSTPSYMYICTYYTHYTHAHNIMHIHKHKCTCIHGTLHRYHTPIVLAGFMSMWYKLESFWKRNSLWRKCPYQIGPWQSLLCWFSGWWLMWEAPAHCGHCHPGLVVLGAVRDPVGKASKLLLQFLPPGFCSLYLNLLDDDGLLCGSTNEINSLVPRCHNNGNPYYTNTLLNIPYTHPLTHTYSCTHIHIDHTYTPHTTYMYTHYIHI